MPLSDPQVLVALVIALIPGILAFRLSTELYKWYTPYCEWSGIFTLSGDPSRGINLWPNIFILYEFFPVCLTVLNPLFLDIWAAATSLSVVYSQLQQEWPQSDSFFLRKFASHWR